MSVSSFANRGASWEADLEAFHRLYRAKGLYVEANPRRWKIIGHIGATFRCVPEATSPPDYTALIKGLPPLLFDAKSATAKGKSAPRWPLADLPPHQAAAFRTWEANGGRAFVLLRLVGVSGFPAGQWLLPWTDPANPGMPRELAARWEEWAVGGVARGEASYTVQDCDLHGVRLDSADWLAAARWLWLPGAP